MNAKIKVEWITDLDILYETIDEAIENYIWSQKEAYGIEYTKADFNVKPTDFTDEIQKWLDEQYSIYDNPFEHENEAAEEWLDRGGYDLIVKAIEA